MSPFDNDKNELVNILLVDDDSRNLDSLEVILSSTDYCLVKAMSGEQALALLLNTTFAVIILDVMMPEMDGFELARLIKSRKKTRDTPIIFLTAYHTDEQDIFLGYSLGAYDYLIKPAHPDILKAKVAAFARLFRTSEAIKRQYHVLTHSAKSFDIGSQDLQQWEKRYLELLLHHVRATRQGNSPPSPQVEHLARDLACEGFNAQAVARLHMRVMETIVKEMMPSVSEAFSLDARLLLLELMGNLVDIYRMTYIKPNTSKEDFK